MFCFFIYLHAFDKHFYSDDLLYILLTTTVFIGVTLVSHSTAFPKLTRSFTTSATLRQFYLLCIDYK